MHKVYGQKIDVDTLIPVEAIVFHWVLYKMYLIFTITAEELPKADEKYLSSHHCGVEAKQLRTASIGV